CSRVAGHDGTAGVRVDDLGVYVMDRVADVAAPRAARDVPVAGDALVRVRFDDVAIGRLHGPDPVLDLAAVGADVVLAHDVVTRADEQDRVIDVAVAQAERL